MKKIIPLLMVIAGVIFIRTTTAPSYSEKIRTPHLIINHRIIPVEIARTAPEVQKGLSGRPSLPEEKGMLFIFKHPAIYRFWMPDMHFPLDMVWIAGNTIVDITHNVSNNFNPKKPIFYIPSRPVTRILEVNAGFAKKNNLRIGDIVFFRYTE